MPKETFKYSNNELTVIWKPNLCIHSKICWTNLRQVFDPTKRPWITMDGADTATIIEQVRQCPSGALSYETTADVLATNKAEAAQLFAIEIKQNGPILIKTACHITHSNGTIETKNGTTALCRCGASNNKPYCDGTHNKIGFEG
jgi:uncharacterized Fe-S cluster protein YjdI